MTIVNFRFCCLFSLTLCLVFLSLASSVNAAEYRLESNYSLQGIYDDNFRFVSDTSNLRDDELSGAKLDASWQARRVTQRDTVGLSLSVEEGVYTDDAFNRTNGNVGFNARRQFERGSIGFSAGGQLRTVRTAQIEDFDGDQFNVLDDSRSESQSLSVVGSWLATQRDTLQLTVSGSHQRFESNRFRGSEFGSASVLYQRAASRKLSLQLDVSYSLLQSDSSAQTVLNPTLLSSGLVGLGLCPLAAPLNTAAGAISFDCFKLRQGDSEQTTLAFRAGIVYRWNERLSFNILFGPSETTTDSTSTFLNFDDAPFGDPVDPIIADGRTSNRLSTNSTLTYDSEQGELTLTADSTETTDSNGLLRETQRFSIKYDRNLSSLWRGGLDLSWLDSEAIDDTDITFFDRTNLRARLFSSYRLSPRWTISGSVLAQWQDGENIDRANRSVYSLSVSWQPGVWSVSR